MDDKSPQKGGGMHNVANFKFQEPQSYFCKTVKF